MLGIFNGFLDVEDTPKEWQEYNIIMVLKLGGKGYRPVALAQSFLKLMESIIKVRIDWYIEINLHIPSNQFGFRKQKSSTGSTVLLMSEIYQAFAKKWNLGALFVDIEGAFDFVVIELLLEDLLEIGLDIAYVRLLKIILRSRKLNIFFNRKKVDTAWATRGVPQGSVLSSLLFNIYLRKINRFLEKCFNLQFADDCCIADSSAALRKL